MVEHWHGRGEGASGVFFVTGAKTLPSPRSCLRILDLVCQHDVKAWRTQLDSGWGRREVFVLLLAAHLSLNPWCKALWLLFLPCCKRGSEVCVS